MSRKSYKEHRFSLNLMSAVVVRVREYVTNAADSNQVQWLGAGLNLTNGIFYSGWVRAKSAIKNFILIPLVNRGHIDNTEDIEISLYLPQIRF